MLTPQEVSERAFAKATFGGYNMVQVDEFLDILTEDYSSLYSENAVLKSKMKVLVDKVEEYRSTEEAMRKALLTAQHMADEMVSEAEQKKDSLLKDAEAEAKRRTADLDRGVEAEELRLQRAQQKTAAFVADVRRLMGQQEDFLSRLEEICPEDLEPAPDTVAETASEIDDNVQKLLAQALSDVSASQSGAPAEGEPQQEEDDTTSFDPSGLSQDGVSPEENVPEQEEDREDIRDDDGDQTRRIDFGDLQFGRDYEIK